MCVPSPSVASALPACPTGSTAAHTPHPCIAVHQCDPNIYLWTATKYWPFDAYQVCSLTRFTCAYAACLLEMRMCDRGRAGRRVGGQAGWRVWAGGMSCGSQDARPRAHRMRSAAMRVLLVSPRDTPPCRAAHSPIWTGAPQVSSLGSWVHVSSAYIARVLMGIRPTGLCVFACAALLAALPRRQSPYGHFTPCVRGHPPPRASRLHTWLRCSVQQPPG